MGAKRFHVTPQLFMMNFLAGYVGRGQDVLVQAEGVIYIYGFLGSICSKQKITFKNNFLSEGRRQLFKATLSKTFFL